jgi:hypothetical protein
VRVRDLDGNTWQLTEISSRKVRPRLKVLARAVIKTPLHRRSCGKQAALLFARGACCSKQPWERCPRDVLGPCRSTSGC